MESKIPVLLASPFVLKSQMKTPHRVRTRYGCDTCKAPLDRRRRRRTHRGSRPAGQQTELLVDADTFSIQATRVAIRLLEDSGHVVNTTIFAPEGRQQNKKWLEFMRESGIGYQPVDKQQTGRLSGEEVDEAITLAVQDLWAATEVDCIALLTGDTGYMDIMQSTLAHGRQAIVLAETHRRTVLSRYEDIGVSVAVLPKEHEGFIGVQAILHADGSGSVRETHLEVPGAPEDVAERRAEAFMQFMSDLDYRQDSGYFIQSAAKFWFENSLRSYSFPAELWSERCI